jgi:hypothetical protein
MNVLELFKGTGSVGKVCEGLGHNVVSVDINKKFNPTHLCDIMDLAKTRGIRNIDDANKTVLKTLEIINYFDCDYWYIENPQTSLLKKQTFMETLPYIDCDYCMYGKPYRKRTRIWTNKKIQLKLCNKKCGSFINGRHIGSCGNGRSKYTNKPYTLEEKYSIPPDLIFSLLFNI